METRGRERCVRRGGIVGDVKREGDVHEEVIRDGEEKEDRCRSRGRCLRKRKGIGRWG